MQYSPQQQCASWHQPFCRMLPRIQRHAWLAFRRLRREAREDAVAEVVAYALIAFVRLVERDMIASAYPTVLARYGVGRYHAGRRVGVRTNTCDIASPAARRKHGFRLDSIDRYDAEEDCWHAMAIEVRSAGPAEIACFRIDFADWLMSLPLHRRRLVVDLAAGETTSSAARMHAISPSRVSQIRQELAQSWAEFQGDTVHGPKNGTSSA